jgi:hypothetical protein
MNPILMQSIPTGEILVRQAGFSKTRRFASKSTRWPLGTVMVTSPEAPATCMYFLYGPKTGFSLPTQMAPKALPEGKWSVRLVAAELEERCVPTTAGVPA